MKTPFYIAPSLYTSLHLSSSGKVQKLRVFCRNTCLLPHSIGSSFRVHNGRAFLYILISQDIIGHKLGEFIQNRRRYFFKKGKKGKAKGKK